MTGGASGIGAAVAQRLARAGATVTVADVQEEAGRRVAGEVNGHFVAADVSDPSAHERAVDAARAPLGALHLVHLNAGLTSGFGVGDDFDEAAYRRVTGVNVDGVVFGVHAALSRLEPGGQIVVTASLAGLTGVPVDPLYATTKHAVVGLVRSLGPTLVQEYGVRINALCPGFADTPMVEPIRDTLRQLGLPLIPVQEVVDAFMAVVGDDRSGECWFVQAGRPSQPFEFRRLPGPRAAPA